MTDTVTHRCTTCDGPVEVAKVPTSSLLAAARGVRTYAWGRRKSCPQCGSTDAPRLVIDEESALVERFDSATEPGA